MSVPSFLSAYVGTYNPDDYNYYMQVNNVRTFKLENIARDAPVKYNKPK